jgi:multidrug efflux pump
MLGATVIAVFFIPMFYYVLESWSSRKSGPKTKPGADAGTPVPVTPVVPVVPAAGGPGAPNATPSARHEDD